MKDGEFPVKIIKNYKFFIAFLIILKTSGVRAMSPQDSYPATLLQSLPWCTSSLRKIPSIPVLRCNRRASWVVCTAKVSRNEVGISGRRNSLPSRPRWVCHSEAEEFSEENILLHFSHIFQTIKTFVKFSCFWTKNIKLIRINFGAFRKGLTNIQ